MLPISAFTSPNPAQLTLKLTTLQDRRPLLGLDARQSMMVWEHQLEWQQRCLSISRGCHGKGWRTKHGDCSVGVLLPQRLLSACEACSSRRFSLHQAGPPNRLQDLRLHLLRCCSLQGPLAALDQPAEPLIPTQSKPMYLSDIQGCWELPQHICPNRGTANQDRVQGLPNHSQLAELTYPENWQCSK